MSKKKKKKLDKYICEYCGNEHNGTYGSGRFCCASCARQFSYQFITDEGKAHQISALADPINRKKGSETRKRQYDSKVKSGEIIPYKSNIKSKIPESKYKPKNGKLGEIATIKKFIEQGIPVYIPLIDEGIDMIADFGNKLQRIQVKSSTRSNSDVVRFSLLHNKNIIKGNTVATEHIKYSSEDIDYFSLYDIPNDELFLIKNNINKGEINIRYNNSKNNKSLKNNKAEDYQIDKVLNEIELNIDPDSIIDTDYEILDED